MTTKDRPNGSRNQQISQGILPGLSVVHSGPIGKSPKFTNGLCRNEIFILPTTFLCEVANVHAKVGKMLDQLMIYIVLLCFTNLLTQTIAASIGEVVPAPSTPLREGVALLSGELVVALCKGATQEAPVALLLTDGLIPSEDMGMGQNPIPLVNIKIAGKWMFIPLKMVCIGIDP
jgi:hypothetical protein